MSKYEQERAERVAVTRRVRNFANSLVPFISLSTFALVVLIFMKMDGSDPSLANNVYNLDQTVDAKVALMANKIDDLSNRLAAVSATAPASGGTGISLSELKTVEKLNREANKYHMIFLVNEITNKLNATEDYSDKLIELKVLAGDQFADPIAALEKYMEMQILNHDQMVKIVEDSTQSTKPTTEEEKSAFENIKGLFKITSHDGEDMRIKCNPIIIDSAVKNLREKNEWEALKTLEQVEPKNDGLKKVVENLNLRNLLKYYLKTISEEIVKNG
jgi:hypothetical protein